MIKYLLDYKLSCDADFTVVACLIRHVMLRRQGWACYQRPPLVVVVVVNIVSCHPSLPPP